MAGRRLCPHGSCPHGSLTCKSCLSVGGLKNPNIQENAEGTQMHMGIACDRCGKCPIIGQRFNSQVVNNYDLCEKCHALPGAERVAPFKLVQNQAGMAQAAMHVDTGLQLKRVVVPDLTALAQGSVSAVLMSLQWQEHGHDFGFV